MRQENIANFLQAARARGVPEFDLFSTPDLFEGKRTERFDVLGKIRFHEHGGIESAVKSPVNRQSAGQSDVARHVRGASPGPPEVRRVVPPSAA